MRPFKSACFFMTFGSISSYLLAFEPTALFRLKFRKGKMLPLLLLRNNLFDWTSLRSVDSHHQKSVWHHQNELRFFMLHILNSVSILLNQACAIFVTCAENCIKVIGCPWGSISYMGSECGWGLYHWHLLFELCYVMSFHCSPQT